MGKIHTGTQEQLAQDYYKASRQVTQHSSDAGASTAGDADQAFFNAPKEVERIETVVEKIVYVDRQVEIPGPTVHVPGPERIVEVVKEVFIPCDREVLVPTIVEKQVTVERIVNVPGPTKIEIRYMDRIVAKENLPVWAPWLMLAEALVIILLAVVR